jgi:hypothetical protein
MMQYTRPCMARMPQRKVPERDWCGAPWFGLALAIPLLMGISFFIPCVAGGQSAPQAEFSPVTKQSLSALPTLDVRLSQTLYRIRVDPKSGAPIMPNGIVASASLADWPADVPQPPTFTWHVFLDWDFKPYPTHHSIGDLKFEHPSPFPVNLASQVRGGRLKVIAKTTFEGREISGQAIAEVRGDNPPRSAVLRAFPPNRLGLIASKIATAESGMQQFNAADGMPMISRTNDVGMMQLNAPTGSITSADQVWDWRANLKRGLEVMDDKHRTTVLASRGSVNRQSDPGDIVVGYEDAVCLNFLRWYLGMTVIAPPIVPPLSTIPGSGILPGEADPDHLSLSQVERDAIRRYNGGHEYALALVTNPDTMTILNVEWQVDPTRGGVRARSGDPDYIGHVLLARSGFVIPAPSKPAKSRHRHRRRHYK